MVRHTATPSVDTVVPTVSISHSTAFGIAHQDVQGLAANDGPRNKDLKVGLVWVFFADNENQMLPNLVPIAITIIK